MKDLSSVIPIVKAIGDSVEKRDSDKLIDPKVLALANQVASSLVYRDFADDLAIFYGFEKEFTFDLVQQSDLQDGMTPDKLHQTAIGNLLKKVKIEVKTTRWGGIGIVCGYDLECSLITLPEVWDFLVEELGNDIVFIVASKDLVVFANGLDDENLKNLNIDLQKISEMYKNEPRMLLSKKVYRYKNGIISVV